jgi:hypothetical protein
VAGAKSSLRTLPGVVDVQSLPGASGQAIFRIQGGDGADLCPAIYGLATSKQWPVRELRADRQTLESVFNQLATAEIHPDQDRVESKRSTDYAD